MIKTKEPITNTGAVKRLAHLNDDWKLRAACRGRPYIVGDKDIFYDLDSKSQNMETKMFCMLSCGVRDYCLLWALYVPEDNGIWGGLDPDERKDLLKRPEVKELLREYKVAAVW